MRQMTDLEKRTYNFIKDAGEVQTTNLTDKRMWGAIPNLKNMSWLKCSRSIPTILDVKKILLRLNRSQEMFVIFDFIFRKYEKE